MNRTHSFGIFVLGLLLLVGLLGCDQRPAVPTIAPEPTQPVVVIVVTATSQPTLAPTKAPEATITPIPTLTPVVTQTVTATVAATAVAQVTRPPASPAAVQPTAEQPTASAPPTVAAPTNFAAPLVFAPEGLAFRDGDTVKFIFASAGPLASDQCYRFDMTLGHPTDAGGAGDWWVGLCGNQSNAGDRLEFDLKPGRFRDEANYGTLLVNAEEFIPPTPNYVMKWFVSVVKVDAVDTLKPNVEALSPASGSLQNTFFR